MLDLLRFALAILPLAAYANILGLLRLRSRPTVLSGAMDTLLLGLGLVGVVAVGPMELFFPRAAYSLLGGWVWFVLIALYFFVLMLVALNTSPKLVVYGLDANALQHQLCALVEQQAIQAKWLGNLVELPELGVRACIEPAGRGRISQIQAAGKIQNLTGWFTLERLLVEKLSSVGVHQRREAILWLLASFAIFGFAAALISSDLPRLHDAVAGIFDAQ